MQFRETPRGILKRRFGAYADHRMLGRGGLLTSSCLRAPACQPIADVVFSSDVLLHADAAHPFSLPNPIRRGGTVLLLRSLLMLLGQPGCLCRRLRLGVLLTAHVLTPHACR